LDTDRCSRIDGLAVFSRAAFYAEKVCYFPFAALTAAQRFRAASAIAFLPATLILRFGLAEYLWLAPAVRIHAFDLGPSLLLGHPSFLRRVAAENLRRLGGVLSAGFAVLATGPPVRRLLEFGNLLVDSGLLRTRSLRWRQ
jgi:hypothetical protein